MHPRGGRAQPGPRHGQYLRGHVQGGEVGEAAGEQLIGQRGGTGADVDHRPVRRDPGRGDQLQGHRGPGGVPADPALAPPRVDAIPMPTTSAAFIGSFIACALGYANSNGGIPWILRRP